MHIDSIFNTINKMGSGETHIWLNFFHSFTNAQCYNQVYILKTKSNFTLFTLLFLILT